jgi:hypothetical protein
MPLLLDACPLCRTTLHGGEEQCPSCGSDLLPYLAAAQRAQDLIGLVRDLLSRGETERAAALLPRLNQLSGLDPALLTELQAQLALARGDSAEALRLADQLAKARGALAARIRDGAAEQQQARLRAYELYNNALGAARRGAALAAAEQLARAVQLEPREPRLWLLKLKADLKARLFSRCYADLAALDRLAARPPEFARLEALLPVTAHAD